MCHRTSDVLQLLQQLPLHPLKFLLRQGALIAQFRQALQFLQHILAFAGVVVALDRNGEVIVHRGMVKPQDRKLATKAAATASAHGGTHGMTGETGEGAAQDGSVNPESLVRKLTSHKTKALQVLLSDNTHVALAALAHTLVQQLVIGYSGGMQRTVSALNLRASDCDGALKSVADDIEASRAWITKFECEVRTR